MLLFVLALSCGSSSSSVIATVEGRKITVGELEDAMKMQRGKYDPAMMNSANSQDNLRRQTLDLLIDEAIILKEAKRLGINVPERELDEKLEAEKKAFGDGLDEAFEKRGVDKDRWEDAQRRRLVISKYIENEVIGGVPVSDAAVAEYYRKNAQEFRQPTQFRARQIVVDKRNTAEEILAKLKKGDDFATLAKQYSQSPDSRRGGDLGFFNASSYPKHFAEVCQQLKPGEISEVVASEYGYQIFQLIDRRESAVRSLKDAAPQIRAELQVKGGEAVLAEKFKELKAKSAIVVNEDALKGVTIE